MATIIENIWTLFKEKFTKQYMWEEEKTVPCPKRFLIACPKRHTIFKTQGKDEQQLKKWYFGPKKDSYPALQNTE